MRAELAQCNVRCGHAWAHWGVPITPSSVASACQYAPFLSSSKKSLDLAACFRGIANGTDVVRNKFQGRLAIVNFAQLIVTAKESFGWQVWRAGLVLRLWQ